MAVERTGSAVSIVTASYTSSQSVTVPADCTCAVVFFGGWEAGADSYFSSGGYTASLGAGSFTHVNRSTSTGDNDDVAAAILTNPPTGSQTLSWSFSASLDSGLLITVVFYKGVDTSSPIVSSGGNDSATTSPLSVTGLSYSSGDMLVGASNCDNAAPGVSGNSQTVIVPTCGPAGAMYMAVAEKSSAGVFEATQSNDTLGIVALVLRAAATATLNQHSFRFFNDDGSESAATVMANLNTNVNLTASSAARIRFLLDATNDPTTRQFQLEYRKKPSGGSFGDWKRVTIN